MRRRVGEIIIVVGDMYSVAWWQVAREAGRVHGQELPAKSCWAATPPMGNRLPVGVFWAFDNPAPKAERGESNDGDKICIF